MEVLIGILLLAMMIFGGDGSQPNQQNNQTNNPQTDKQTPGLVIDDKGKGQGGQPNKPTAIPTPALLPGLIGLGVAAFRKRKTEKGEANV